MNDHASAKTGGFGKPRQLGKTTIGAGLLTSSSCALGARAQEPELRHVPTSSLPSE